MVIANLSFITRVPITLGFAKAYLEILNMLDKGD